MPCLVQVYGESSVSRRLKGVKVLKGLSKVTLPLLLTYSSSVSKPPRLTSKPIGTKPVEPSSLAAKTLESKPD